VTFALVLPAFLRWEPLRTGESVGSRLMWLSGAALLLFSVAFWRVARAIYAGYAVARRWQRESARLDNFTGVPVYELPNAGGLVATTGIFASRIFVSSNVTASLSAAELDAALAHERAHIRSADNLKQLLLRALRLPIAAGDRVWSVGTEISADLHALQSGTPAMELASALVKVARLRNTIRIDACAAASCLIPAGQEKALGERVRRLTKLVSDDAQPAPPASRRWTWAYAVAALAAIAMATHPAVLHLTHELIEKLV
jgi:Zn-dependent protease with chaperone function